MDMNKQVGMIIGVFVAVFVGIVLFQVVAQEAGKSTTLDTLVNTSFTAPANGESGYVTTYRHLSDLTVTNSSGSAIAEGNFTVTNNVVYNGALAVQVQVDSDEYESQEWLLSGTAQPLTYAADAGTRAVIPLIAIFFALALAVVAMVPALRNDLIDMMKR